MTYPLINSKDEITAYFNKSEYEAIMNTECAFPVISKLETTYSQLSDEVNYYYILHFIIQGKNTLCCCHCHLSLAPQKKKERKKSSICTDKPSHLQSK